jgi:hypothetical protein
MGGDGCEGGKKIEQAKKGNAKGSTLGVSANWTGQDSQRCQGQARQSHYGAEYSRLVTPVRTLTYQ